MSDNGVLEDLAQRIERLERTVYNTGPITPAPSITPTFQPQGCVCPIGAELGCGNTACPRRAYGPLTPTS